MKRLILLVLLPALLILAVSGLARAIDKNVPWTAQAEIARRGAIAQRIDGTEDANNPSAAIAAAMQPPVDDSYKWLFTLVTTRNCQWCEQMRRDFENNSKLKAWVDTKDYTKSWAHWQVVQIEDQSQAWRWKDFRPTSFPTLIVQPPVNGSWGDSHTIVFAHQGYLKPAELDAAIRKAIQLYATKAFPKRLAWQSRSTVAFAKTSGGIQQGRGAEQGGGWTPPVTPPTPLPPTPLQPQPSYPNYPAMPVQIPPQQPDAGSLLGQLLSSLLGGAATANILLLAILGWQIYRGIAKKEGIPLLIDDATAAQLIQILESTPRPSTQPSTATTARQS